MRKIARRGAVKLIIAGASAASTIAKPAIASVADSYPARSIIFLDNPMTAITCSLTLFSRLVKIS